MKRVFLKLSGEALAGEKHTGFDEPTVTEVARQVKQITDQGIQVGIVIGGGNFWMKTQILTPFECGSMTKLFSKDRANKYFEKGMVVFFAGGTGHPYFSTDTGIVLRAIEMEAEGIYLAKAIDGVYDSDPKINPSAVKYSEVSIQEVIDRKLAVVDLTESIMCMENKMPMFVFGLNEENSIVKAMTGDFNGTKVTV